MCQLNLSHASCLVIVGNITFKQVINVTWDTRRNCVQMNLGMWRWLPFEFTIVVISICHFHSLIDYKEGDTRLNSFM